MFIVTVIFAGRESGVQLWFDGAEAARRSYLACLNGDTATDHYGNTLWLHEAPSAVLMADHEKQLRATAACALIQARVQAETNEQAQSDPVLRDAQRKQQLAAARQQAAMMPLSGMPGPFRG